jgi:hypothetical protein
MFLAQSMLLDVGMKAGGRNRGFSLMRQINADYL